QLWGSPGGQPLENLSIPDHLQFPKTYADGRIAPTIRVIDHWVQQIRQGQTSAPSFKEGVYAQLLMDLAHQSHEMGLWVEVPDLDSFLAEL
ncbi:MAG: oxidoreductase, partial [Acaryochloridaceae cyanobacterium CSU_5_19]|nr:oxidoreductase [Acaryochloridaceae cyanobacterium CSU_5_19]